MSAVIQGQFDDTGFSGFVQIPKSVAIDLQLTLRATTTSMTLADNRTVTRQASFGIALLNGRPEGGMFYLDENFPYILLGMDFLRIFEKTLIISARSTVSLIDNARLPHVLQRL